MSEQATETDKDGTVRVSSKVHRRLLTIQYQRRMAGEALSFSEIIDQALDKAGTP